METRIRVAGIWLSDGAILLESLADRDVWGVPGGRLEDGESLEEGCAREYQEEVGLEIVCSSLAIVNESFWGDGRTAIREYGFYFRIAPISQVPGPRPGVRSLEGHMKFGWFEMGELKRLAMVPEFLKDVLPGLPQETVFIKSHG